MRCAACREPVDVGAYIVAVFRSARLTEKEKVIAHLVLRGFSLPEIARLLGNTEKTVKCHVTKIYERMGVTSRLEFFSVVCGFDDLPLPELAEHVWQVKRRRRRRPVADATA